MQKAFRTAGIIRGAHPYAIVVDDIQKDDVNHHYDWILALEPDIQIAKITKLNDREMDIILTGEDPFQKNGWPKEPLSPSTNISGIPKNQPMLLVRILNRNTTAAGSNSEPTIPKWSLYPKVRRAVFAN